MRLTSLFKYTFLLVVVFLMACESPITSHIEPYIKDADLASKVIETESPIQEQVILIGDAGKSDKGDGKYLLSIIPPKIKREDIPQRIVFLGDNIYQKGFQSDDTDCGNGSEEANRLDAQLQIGKQSQIPSDFVPGNHDWDYHNKPGLIILEKQKNYIENCGHETKFLPSAGGGITILSKSDFERYTIVYLDSHALMFAPNEKRESAFKELDKIFAQQNSEKPLFLAAHHPIHTYGPHGGCYQQDFPGYQIINFFRRNGYSWEQDMNAKKYAHYIESIQSRIPRDKKISFLAGHDHNLQIIQLAQGADFSIVSGAGSHTDPACHGDGSLFSQEALGYITLNFHQNDEIVAEVFSLNPNSRDIEKVYSHQLY